MVQLLSKQLLSPLQNRGREQRSRRKKASQLHISNLVSPPQEWYSMFQITIAPHCLSVKQGATAVEQRLLAGAFIIRTQQQVSPSDLVSPWRVKNILSIVMYLRPTVSDLITHTLIIYLLSDLRALCGLLHSTLVHDTENKQECQWLETWSRLPLLHVILLLLPQHSCHLYPVLLHKVKYSYCLPFTLGPACYAAWFGYNYTVQCQSACPLLWPLIDVWLTESI